MDELWYVCCDASRYDAYFKEYEAACDYARATSKEIAPCTVSAMKVEIRGAVSGKTVATFRKGDKFFG